MAKHIYKPIEVASREFYRSELEIIYMNQCLGCPEIVLFENHLYVDLIGLNFIYFDVVTNYELLERFFGEEIMDKLEFDETDFLEDYQDCVVTDIHADENKRGYDFVSTDSDDYPDRYQLKHWKSL